MENFGENLLRLIKESGKSQKQFAIESGLTEAAISRYINNNRKPNLLALITLKKTLGCEWDTLLNC